MQSKPLVTRVFIVPYRDRKEHKFFFSHQMTSFLATSTDYEIYFVHQADMRSFNRGAMKNIGFLAMKDKYPDSYKEINFIFNDVDTLPFYPIFDYTTTPGIVKHYYGFETALGGIVVIRGADFEKLNGYPNYWGWGLEDTVLQRRCQRQQLSIDRTQFFTIGSPEILQLFDGVSRLLCPRDTERCKADMGKDGLTTIHKLAYTINENSSIPADNKYIVQNPRIHMINATFFLTLVLFEPTQLSPYDIRDPIPTQRGAAALANSISPEQWKIIPPKQNFHKQDVLTKQVQKTQGPVPGPVYQKKRSKIRMF